MSERQLLVVGMAVVPGDELGRRPGPRELLAGDPEPPVRLRAEGVDDRVVELDEVAVRDVAPDLDVPEEAEARLLRNPLERARNALQLGMVRRPPEPHEAPRRRQPLEHVHLEPRLSIEQRGGGVNPSRPRADDRDAQRAFRHETIVLSGTKNAGGGPHAGGEASPPRADRFKPPTAPRARGLRPRALHAR